MQTRELPLGPAKTAREETEEGGESGRQSQVIQIQIKYKYKYKSGGNPQVIANPHCFEILIQILLQIQTQISRKWSGDWPS